MVNRYNYQGAEDSDFIRLLTKHCSYLQDTSSWYVNLIKRKRFYPKDNRIVAEILAEKVEEQVRVIEDLKLKLEQINNITNIALIALED